MKKPPLIGIKIKRHKAGWDHHYLAKMLAAGQNAAAGVS